LENSVIGAFVKGKFKKESEILFEKFQNGVYIPVISSLVLEELDNGAPNDVVDNLEKLEYEEFRITNEMKKLAVKYIENNVVTQRSFDDALHIAAATTMNVDILVSCNFKHIVNSNKIKKFNEVNLKEGYNTLEIKRPGDVK
jgi:hypothetical protein